MKGREAWENSSWNHVKTTDIIAGPVATSTKDAVRRGEAISQSYSVVMDKTVSHFMNILNIDI